MGRRHPTLRQRILYMQDTAAWLTVQMFPPPPDQLGSTERQYRYQLPILPELNDPVMNTMKTTIQQLNAEDILFSAAGIKVFHATTSPPPWPYRNNSPKAKFYIFTRHNQEFPMTVPISLSEFTKTLEVDQIQVRVSNKWESFKTWLISMREPKYILSGESGIRIQRKWWNRNGRHFPIMKLPLEMRYIIYQHILGGNMYPDTSSTGAVRLSGEFAEISDHKAGSRAWPSDGKIFLVCKQVRQEALKAAWEGTWKHFITSWNFEAVVQSSNPPSGFNWLTHIQLNLGQNEWFRLFGIAINPFLHAIDAPRALLLRNISTLKALEMYFPDPHSRPALVNSWKEYIWDNEHQDWFRNDSKYKDMRAVPCYNVITDWIILFGFPFIKHIPNVLLRGFIKSRMRTKWSRILNVEYRERKCDYRSHGFDYEQDIRSLEHWPVYATPECKCRMACDRDNIQPDLNGRDWVDFDNEE